MTLPTGCPRIRSKNNLHLTGAFGCCTHNLLGYQYTWDFDVPYGTAVISVSDGKVIQVFEPNSGGGCDRRFNDVAHNIKILNGDGSVAQYVHVHSKVHIPEYGTPETIPVLFDQLPNGGVAREGYTEI